MSSFSAMVFRFDHCLGDGVAMVEVFTRLLTDVEDNPLSTDMLHGLKRTTTTTNEPPPTSAANTNVKSCGGGGGCGDTNVISCGGGGGGDTKKFGGDLSATLCCPVSSALMSAFGVVRRAVIVCRNVCRGVLRTLEATTGALDTATEFSWDMKELKEHGVKLGQNFKLVKAPPLRLDTVRAIKKAAGCSVNDVLLCAFSGVARRYCAKYGSHGGAPISMDKPLRIRALLPVGFPRPVGAYKDGDTALTNRMAVTPIDLAVNKTTSSQRLNETIRLVEDMKSIYLPYVIKYVQWFLASFLPIKVLQKVAGDLFARHSVVFANVPGCQQPCRFAGELVYEVQVAFCSLLPQVEIVSYAGRLFFNVVANSGRFSHMEAIPELFVEELQQLATDFGVTEPILHPAPFSRAVMLN
eukprot:GHVS01106114.1.p1 GENE.GHVS01106114.1~~GHVS01106114.1.p1  ORF type:complete len:435 (+),score=99.11 GHVS01106114.1:76-1305(+)